MREMLREMDALKARWMTGGSAVDMGPKEWQGLDDLTLLALTGQFTRIATRPESAVGTTLRPEIPALDLPVLDEALRPLLRRALQDKTAKAPDIIRLVAARGFCVNPVDWMPKASDTGLPDAYGPWRDWQEGSGTARPEAEVLSADTWEEFPPHLRYRRLTQMHELDAEAARAVIEAVAPTLAADQRLRLVGCLAPRLTQADAPLLETFLNDRSSKITGFVKVQLARLGKVTDADETAAKEVPDYLEVVRAGMLSRKQVLTARKLKNKAQEKRRADILGRVSLADLARAVGLSPDDVIALWDFSAATDALGEVVAATGTDAQVIHLTERAFAASVPVPDSLKFRLSPAERIRFGLMQLERDTWSLDLTQAWIAAPDGSADLPALTEGTALKELIKQAAQAEKPHEVQTVAHALSFLGLIADSAAAAVLIDRLTGAGVMALDPRLTLLRLNAALKEPENVR